MTPERSILDYERASASWRTRWARTVLRHKPWPAALLIVCWLIICLATVVRAISCRDKGIVYTPPVYVSTFVQLALACVGGGFWGLVRLRRWRTLLLCACLVVVTGVASGALQLAGCPHATYLQVAGLRVPVSGNPCNNEQDYYLQPWWMQ